MIKSDIYTILIALGGLDDSMQTPVGQLLLEDMRLNLNAKISQVEAKRKRAEQRRAKDEEYGERSIVRDMREESRR
jgi:hypothetical protein